MLNNGLPLVSVIDSWQISVSGSFEGNPVVSVSQMTVLASARRSIAHSSAFALIYFSSVSVGFIVCVKVVVVGSDAFAPFEDF